MYSDVRFFDGEWACVACGEPFSVRVYCYRAESLNGDANLYLHEAVALGRHECPLEPSCSVEAGDIWSPLTEDVPSLPAWEEMEAR